MVLNLTNYIDINKLQCGKSTFQRIDAYGWHVAVLVDYAFE